MSLSLPVCNKIHGIFAIYSVVQKQVATFEFYTSSYMCIIKFQSYYTFYVHFTNSHTELTELPSLFMHTHYVCTR